jgi:hypothetical protein
MDIEHKNYIIRVQETKYGLDIRKWFRDKETNELKPTSKGITFNPALKDKIIEALNTI